MATASQKKATNSHRGRAAKRGLVRLEVQATVPDSGLIRELAQELRKDGPRAVELRASLELALNQPKIRTAFDIFGSDIADENFDEIFDQPREKAWREIDL